MAEFKFEIADCATHITGVPKMVVTNRDVINDANCYECVWMDKSDKKQDSQFREYELKACKSE